MTVTVANTANTNTFQYWLARTNELASAMTSKAVTVSSNAATGNAEIFGSLFSTNIYANTARGGNSSVTTVLTVASNTLIATGNNLTVGNSSVNAALKEISLVIGTAVVNTTQVSLGSNVVILPASITVGNSTVNTTHTATDYTVSGVSIVPLTINVQTSGTSAQLVDSFVISTHRAAEYVLTITNNAANGYHMTKILALQDTGDTLISEFGTVYSNVSLGIFTANANSTHSRLYVTPVPSNTQIKGYKRVIVV